MAAASVVSFGTRAAGARATVSATGAGVSAQRLTLVRAGDEAPPAPLRAGPVAPDPETWEPPTEWRFSDADRERFQGFWQVPVRLVQKAGVPGPWASLWRQEGTTRGGGAVASVLPVLACHTWPSKGGASEAATWTPLGYLSVRRIARLAGVTKQTVAEAFGFLEAQGLLEKSHQRPPAGWGGPPRLCYRLHRTLYREGGERAVKFPALMLYGGHWAMLPRPSARQLYLTILCTQAISDEGAYLRGARKGGSAYGMSRVEAEQVLKMARARRALPLGQLATLAGMQRSTAIEALEVLQAPVGFEGAAYVGSGRAASDRSWYAVRPMDWHWNSDVLNSSASERAARQRRLWPFLGGHALVTLSKSRTWVTDE